MWPRENEEVNKFSLEKVKFSKFSPEGTLGPIWPEVVVLEPWQPGDHASIKKFVDLTCSKTDIFTDIFKVLKKCWVIPTPQHRHQQKLSTSNLHHIRLISSHSSHSSFITRVSYCEKQNTKKTLVEWGCLLSPLKLTQRHRATFCLYRLKAGRPPKKKTGKPENRKTKKPKNRKPKTENRKPRKTRSANEKHIWAIYWRYVIVVFVEPSI